MILLAINSYKSALSESLSVTMSRASRSVCLPLPDDTLEKCSLTVSNCTQLGIVAASDVVLQCLFIQTAQLETKVDTRGD